MTGYLYNAEGQRVVKGMLTTFRCDTQVGERNKKPGSELIRAFDLAR